MTYMGRQEVCVGCFLSGLTASQLSHYLWKWLLNVRNPKPYQGTSGGCATELLEVIQYIISSMGCYYILGRLPPINQ